MSSRRVALALCALLAASPVAAQDTAVLFGRVRTADGRPVARLELVVAGPSGSVSVVTDRGGECRVGDLAHGEYVVVNAYDHTNVWYEEFETVEGEILENDIDLMGRTADIFVSLRF